MKRIAISIIVALLLVGALPIHAQEPDDNLACQEEDVDRTIVAVNGLLDQAQIDLGAGDLVTSLGRLADVQLLLTTLVSQCVSQGGSSLAVEPRNTVCFAGLVLCELIPQAEGGQTFFGTNLGETPLELDERSADCARSGAYGLSIGYGFVEDDYGFWGVDFNDSVEGTFDASRFSGLTFWVKGNSSARERFVINLDTEEQGERNVDTQDYVEVSDGEWRMVAIPMEAFRGDPGAIRRVILRFTNNHGQGSVCIDDFTFVP